MRPTPFPRSISFLLTFSSSHPAGGLTNRGHGSKQKHVPAGPISKSCSLPVPPGPPAPSRLHAARPLASSRTLPLNALLPLRGQLSSARCPWMVEGWGAGRRNEKGKPAPLLCTFPSAVCSTFMLPSTATFLPRLSVILSYPPLGSSINSM